jgi:glycine cleavage system H lipoate-binding protein
MNCKKCGHWRIEIFYHDRTKPHGKCICRECGETWFIEKHNLFKEEQMMKNQDNQALPPGAQMMDVFGFQVPTSDYYLHRGHAWAVLEDTGLVRVGMDDFSQKVLGPADELKLPAVGMLYYQDHICMALIKQGQKASFQAPVDGAIAAVNPKVQEKPSLIHDDPYGEGWLFRVMPTNFQHNLDNLFYAEDNADWIYQESHRLMNLMETEVGVTVPDGGTFIDDVYSNYPELGWRRLVQEFLLTSLTKEWKQRS